jgi:hypothetical protein
LKICETSSASPPIYHWQANTTSRSFLAKQIGLYPVKNLVFYHTKELLL